MLKLATLGARKITQEKKKVNAKKVPLSGLHLTVCEACFREILVRLRCLPLNRAELPQAPAISMIHNHDLLDTVEIAGNTTHSIEASVPFPHSLIASAIVGSSGKS